MGLSYAPISLMMLREAPPGREGWASSSLNLSDVLGQSIGIGLGGAAVAGASTMGWAASTGVTMAFAVAAVGAAVALSLTRRLPRQGLDCAPRTRRPGVAPVDSPSRQTSTPLTKV